MSYYDELQEAIPLNDNHGGHLKERKLQVRTACAEVDRLRAELAELHKDKAIINELERRGVQSIYFVDGSQINPASQCLRAAMSLTPASGDKELAELAALRLDRERLEAVAANGWRLSCEFGANGHPNHWICYDKDWSRPEGEGETYNAAIDAARHSLNP